MGNQKNGDDPKCKQQHAHRISLAQRKSGASAEADAPFFDFRAMCGLMLPALAASAAAARAVGYPGLADLIERDGIGPEQIAALLKLSCSKCARKDYALIILAGAVGRYRACPGRLDGRTGKVPGSDCSSA